ncbi:MAG: FMN-binding glutamate synthase family protein [Peptococcaceae bacterium]|nr:FMN-binding glutamate synthase family protein [Peptococcaceae bacterium]
MWYLSLQFWLILLFALLVALVALNWWRIVKAISAKLLIKVATTVMTDPYGENLLELLHAVKRNGLQSILELSLRSERGAVINRPLGSNRKFPDFSGLMFDVAQIHVLPTEDDIPVNTAVVIGPHAAKPLRLATPIIVSGMAFGMGLSAKAKIALARGSALAGTACNSGEGPFLQAERDNAKYYILQYNRGFWNKEPQTVRQADAIEIQLGQGALAGLSHRMLADKIDARLRRAFPIRPGQDALVMARHRGMQHPEDIITLVAKVRDMANGVPVGIKMAASKDLELDLELAITAGVDFIALSGAQAGSHGAPPSIGDTHGLPTLYALTRAANYLEQHKLKGQVSLISSGGYSEPGEILKALAVGADAVYIGTAALFAISHTQVLKALPWEPPTQVAWYAGKSAEQLDVDMAAKNLANFINSATQEMAQSTRAIGKTSFTEISREDLFALDQLTADIVGVPLGYTPTGKHIRKYQRAERTHSRTRASTPVAAPHRQQPQAASAHVRFFRYVAAKKKPK